jgi:ribonuclease HII
MEENSYLGQMASSLFTEEGRQKQLEESKQLKAKNLKSVMEECKEKNKLVMHDNHNQKIIDEHNELEQLKKGLMQSSFVDTVHPNKFAQKSEISDLNQNIF